MGFGGTPMIDANALKRLAAPMLALIIAGCAVAPPEEAVVPWPPPLAPETEQADLIVVEKAERRLRLYRDKFPIASFDVELGSQPEGHKAREGDGKTPEGLYWIAARNPKSAFHLSLLISYPNEADKNLAAERGEDPGGAIVIHGGTGLFDRLKGALRGEDWTEGCIAVTNAEMERIWSLTPVGTPIVIRP